MPTVNVNLGDEMRLTADAPMTVTYEPTGPVNMTVRDAIDRRDEEITRLRLRNEELERRLVAETRIEADAIIDRFIERLQPEGPRTL